ncbi:tRNA-ribosyltransferase, partial [Halobacteriales archaeon QS_4_62_28]
LPEGSEHVLTVLPHRGLPGGTPDEVTEAFAVDYPDVDFPSAAVVSNDAADDYGADAYVLSGAPGLTGHAEVFVDAVIRTRDAIPDDTALVLSGVATPRNVATLIYAGVDLVDTDRAVVRGTQGRYLTTDDAYFLEDLDELPCSCPACQGPRDTFDRQDCVEHNVNALEAELARVRRRIRDGRLRDYIEGQARQDQWLTATMRRLDQQYAYLERHAPIYRREEITAATEDTMGRVEIQRFAQRVTERYQCRFEEQPLVIVPCSARKPYSDSQSYEQYHRSVQFRGHMLSMTSPIGVVPQELELTYPAQHYDSVVTGHWSANEIEFVSDVLERYLDGTSYPEVIAHVPEDGYREICERVEDALDMDFTDTVEDHPTTTDSLAELAGALEGYPKYLKRERQHNTLRAVADYQFGAGAGDAIFGEDLTAEGTYPQLRAHGERTGDSQGEQLAALTQQYGVLGLTIAGARRWVDSGVPVKRVEIDDFVPHGSVLAPGIIDASDAIRVGDEVVVEGPSAFGVGRAQMPGPAMADATRGVACQVRHVEEQYTGGRTQ